MMRTTLSRALRATVAKPTTLSYSIRTPFMALKSAAATPRILSPFVTRRNYSAAPELTKEVIQARIIELLEDYDKVADKTKITPEASFSSDLGLDSLDVVEVVMAIEEEFTIQIPDDDADSILTVGQAIDYIAAQPDAC